MKFTVVGIEKLGSSAKVTLHGKAEGTIYQSQIYVYFPWGQVAGWPIDATFELRPALPGTDTHPLMGDLPTLVSAKAERADV